MLRWGPAALIACVAAVVVVVVVVQVEAVYGGSPASVLRLERAFPVNQSVEVDVLRARDRARHHRILQGYGGSDGGGVGVVDFVIEGSSDPNGVGLYFTRVKLGTPLKEYNVQIDTGSDILWVTCNSCSDCPQTSGLGIKLNSFDISTSSTAGLVLCGDPLCSVQTTLSQCSQTQCSYSFQYQDGSGTSGYYVSDLFYFDMILGNSMVDNSSASIVFGCSTYQSGDLTQTEKAVDGIFGLGQQSLSVISQLSSRGITPKAFSHCLEGAGNGGGILVLGEILDPRIVYSPLIPSRPHYTLNLQSIAVNGQLLPIDQSVFSTSNGHGTIIDTGTTLAYLVEEAYEPLVSVITNTVSQSARPVLSGGTQCYLVSTISVSDLFPSVSLNFESGASMVLRPEEYLTHSDFEDGGVKWCLGFEKAQDQGISILGDLVLKDKIFVYDLDRQQIGWANYNCSQSVNVSVTFGKDEHIDTVQMRVSSSSRNAPFGLVGPLIETLVMLIISCVCLS